MKDVMIFLLIAAPISLMMYFFYCIFSAFLLKDKSKKIITPAKDIDESFCRINAALNASTTDKDLAKCFDAIVYFNERFSKDENCLNYTTYFLNRHERKVCNYPDFFETNMN